MNAKYGKVKSFDYRTKKQVSSDLQKLSEALQKRFKESFVFLLNLYLKPNQTNDYVNNSLENQTIPCQYT